MFKATEFLGDRKWEKESGKKLWGSARRGSFSWLDRALFLLSLSSPTLCDSVPGFSLCIPCSEIPGPSLHLRAFITMPYCLTFKPGFPVQVDLLSSPAATHPILYCLTLHDDNGLIPLPMMPIPASPPNFSITAVVPPSTRARTLGIFLDSPLSHQSLHSVNFTFYM